MYGKFSQKFILFYFVTREYLNIRIFSKIGPTKDNIFQLFLKYFQLNCKYNSKKKCFTYKLSTSFGFTETAFQSKREYSADSRVTQWLGMNVK